MKRLLLFLLLLLAIPAQAATFYVSTTGSDGNACTAGGASACATLNGAYGKAAAGDTIIWQAGSYTGQTINATAESNYVFITLDTAATVTVAGMEIFTDYVSVDGANGTLTINNGLDIKPENNIWSSTNIPANVVVKNVEYIKSIFVVGDRITLQNFDAGNFSACTPGNQEDVIQLWQLPDSGGTYHAASNVLIEGATIHDITDNGNECGTGLHVDCMQILAGHFITLRNNKFYNCATSDVIARPFRDSLNDLTFENNWFQEVLFPGAAFNMGASGDTFGGTNVARNNVMQSAGVTCQPANCFYLYGNIYNAGSCNGNVVYDGNMSSEGFAAECGTNASEGDPMFVNNPVPGYQNMDPPDFLLQAGSEAIDAGSLISYPTLDIIGNTRYTGTKPDAGSHELDSAPLPNISILPASDSLNYDEMLQFTANLTGGAVEPVTWSASCGSIDADGLYTAPSAGTGTCTITGSVDNPDDTDTAVITLPTPGGGGCTGIDFSNGFTLIDAVAWGTATSTSGDTATLNETPCSGNGVFVAVIGCGTNVCDGTPAFDVDFTNGSGDAEERPATACANKTEGFVVRGCIGFFPNVSATTTFSFTSTATIHYARFYVHLWAGMPLSAVFDTDMSTCGSAGTTSLTCNITLTQTGIVIGFAGNVAGGAITAGNSFTEISEGCDQGSCGDGNQTQARSNTAGAANSNWTQSSDAIHGYAVGIKATGAAPADVTPSQIAPMIPFN